MKIFKRFLKGRSEELSEDEKEKFETIFLDEENSSVDESKESFDNTFENKPREPPISLEDQVKEISDLVRINKLRNLLDERERQITGNLNLHVPEAEESSLKSSFIDEEQETKNVTPSEDKFSREVLDDEIEEYIEVTENELKPKKSAIDIFIDEAREVFGSENVYEKFQENSKEPIDSLNGKNVTYLGIMNRKFFDTQVSVDEETSWFIKSVKSLTELPKFKVLRSDYGRKDLVWEYDSKHTVVLSFRASSSQRSKDEFDFSL